MPKAGKQRGRTEAGLEQLYRVLQPSGGCIRRSATFRPLSSNRGRSS